MASSQHTAEVVIRGNTEGASKSLKGLADDAGKAKKAVDAAGDSGAKFGDKLDSVEKKLGGLSAGLGKITGLLGAGALIGAAMGAAQAIGEMADRAGQLTAANQALKISIEGARNATAGMVSDFDLTLAANKAVQLGVVKTDAEFAKLASAASRLGMALGQDAAKSVDDLTVALGRQSFEILDNLGIVLKQSEANEIWAQRLGKSAAALTDAEKKAGFMAIALERAEEAAAKSNVTLDTSANKVAALGAKWTNLKDAVSSAVVEGIATAIDPSAALNAEMEKLVKTAEAMAENSRTLQDRLLAYTDKTHGAAGATVNFLAQLSLTNEELSKFQRASLEEQNLALTKERFLTLKGEEDERRKSMVLAERDRDLAADRLEISKKQEEQSRKAAKAKAEEASPKSRDISFDASVGVTEDMSRAERQQEYNVAFADEIALREDRITMLEHEAELAQMQLDAGLIEADAVEELARRKYEAESELLDFQIQAAATREEILDLETQKRRKAAAEQMQVMSRAQSQEIKALQQKQARYEQVGTAVGDSLGKVAQAAIKAAEGEEYAVRKALAAIATGIRDQMILTALKEFALAIASAASFNYPGAAQHAAAGGLATAAAVVAGGMGAAINSTIPAEPSIDAGASPESPDASSSGASKGKSRGSGAGEGGDDDGVPTSYYDADLWAKRPDRQGRRSEHAKSAVTVNAVVLGTTKEEVGVALQKILRDAERSNPKAVRA